MDGASFPDAFLLINSTLRSNKARLTERENCGGRGDGNGDRNNDGNNEL